MFNKIWGWLVLATGFAIALALPLILLGVPKQAVWPICLACAAVLLLARPGGTVEKCMSILFSYGIVFAIWCVSGILLVVVFNLLFSWPKPPESIFVVFTVGAVGVIRELQKSSDAPNDKPGA